jgi:SAM-dependent methyltransferase
VSAKPPDPRAHVSAVAAPFLERGDPVGWFDALYRTYEGELERIPWAGPAGHALYGDWLAGAPALAGARTLVVGCGLGEEAEQAAAAGCAVTAFDVSPTAIAWARRRFPASPVHYRVADLFEPPPQWRASFEVVTEIYTVQALPLQLRERALDAVAGFVAPGGRLFLLARGRGDDEPPGDVPWPLSRAELAHLGRAGLVERDFTDHLDRDVDPPMRRFRVLYERPR